MAEKAVSSAAAKQAATSAPASAPTASQNTDLAKGLEAYKNGDFKTAHDLFKKAATAGDAEACYQLGVMLSTGKGTVAKNTLQAKVWLKKAASLGHPNAERALVIL
jgi:TPR repeat protein